MTSPLKKKRGREKILHLSMQDRSLLQQATTNCFSAYLTK